MNIYINFKKANNNRIINTTDYDVVVDFDGLGMIETKHAIINDGEVIKDLPSYLENYYSEWAKLVHKVENPIALAIEV